MEPLSATTTILIVSIAVFAVGIVIGLLASLLGNGFNTGDLQLVVGSLVTIVWVVSIISEILIPTYTVSVLIHGIMGAVVGYLFSDEGLTLNIGSGNNNNNENE
jgi:hypothetical protein